MHFFPCISFSVSKFIDQNQLPHLLFYGPPGTGKTTSILACARRLYGERAFQSMVLELNASDDRGIGIVRGRILDFASTKTIFSKGFKLIILDEADAMTNDAQNALRRGNYRLLRRIFSWTKFRDDGISFLCFQLSRNTPTTFASASFVIISARLFPHFNLDALAFDSLR